MYFYVVNLWMSMFMLECACEDALHKYVNAYLIECACVCICVYVIVCVRVGRCIGGCPPLWLYYMTWILRDIGY